MKFIPFNDFLVIEKVSNVEKSKGGLIIPEEARTSKDIIYGRVIEIPQLSIDSPFMVGDLVMFCEDYALLNKVDGKELYFIDYDKVIAKVEV